MNNEIVIVILIVVLAAIATAIARFFGIDLTTVLAIAEHLFVVVVVWSLVWWATPITLKHTWPVALATLWTVFWPALDYWSQHAAPADFVKLGVVEQAWYAQWYTEYGILAAIVGLGYAINYWVDNR